MLASKVMAQPRAFEEIATFKIETESLHLVIWRKDGRSQKVTWGGIILDGRLFTSVQGYTEYFLST